MSPAACLFTFLPTRSGAPCGPRRRSRAIRTRPNRCAGPGSDPPRHRVSVQCAFPPWSQLFPPRCHCPVVLRAAVVRRTPTPAPFLYTFCGADLAHCCCQWSLVSAVTVRHASTASDHALQTVLDNAALALCAQPPPFPLSARSQPPAHCTTKQTNVWQAPPGYTAAPGTAQCRCHTHTSLSHSVASAVPRASRSTAVVAP